MTEFTFKPGFIPPKRRVDIDDYERGIPDIELPPLIDEETPAAQSAASPAALTAASICR